MKKSLIVRYSAIALGAALLVSAGAAAASAEENLGDTDIDVNVEIPQIDEPGLLALTVASGSTTLSEDGSNGLDRRFTGTLPTVTVTDTRTADEIPAGSAWYVMGSASEFTAAGSTATISAEHLGWTPELVEGAGAGEDFISVGGDVAPVADGGAGLVDQELLYLGEAEEAASSGGSWSATAELLLKVPATVEPGSYTSTITLSLFQ